MRLLLSGMEPLSCRKVSVSLGAVTSAEVGKSAIDVGFGITQ